jgi:hypothetical protein
MALFNDEGGWLMFSTHCLMLQQQCWLPSNFLPLVSMPSQFTRGCPAVHYAVPSQRGPLEFREQKICMMMETRWPFLAFGLLSKETQMWWFGLLLSPSMFTSEPRISIFVGSWVGSRIRWRSFWIPTTSLWDQWRLHIHHSAFSNPNLEHLSFYVFGPSCMQTIVENYKLIDWFR